MLGFSLLVNIPAQRNLLPYKVFLLTGMLVAKSLLVNAVITVVKCAATVPGVPFSTMKEAGK
jgi:hypothetical protein